MTEIPDEEAAGAILRAALALDRAPPVGDALIAAWAEERLDPERAAIVEAHLAADDEARAYAFALREELLGTAGAHQAPASVPLPSLAAARSRRATWVPFAVAAALLLALGTMVLSPGSRPGLVSLGDQDSDARLVAAADDLARRSPELFGDFRPIGAAERRATVGDVMRSGLSILEPLGHVVGRQPPLRWASTAGATSYDVVVADADGAVIWRTTTALTRVAPGEGPDLEPGRAYLIEVSAAGPLGRTTASRSFDVAERTAVDALATAREALGRALGDPLGDLARAHLAARRGFLIEAKAAVEAYLVRNPKDAAAISFDEYVRRRLGWPEGATTTALERR